MEQVRFALAPERGIVGSLVRLLDGIAECEVFGEEGEDSFLEDHVPSAYCVDCGIEIFHGGVHCPRCTAPVKL